MGNTIKTVTNITIIYGEIDLIENNNDTSQAFGYLGDYFEKISGTKESHNVIQSHDMSPLIEIKCGAFEISIVHESVWSTNFEMAEKKYGNTCQIAFNNNPRKMIDKLDKLFKNDSN